MTDLTDDAADEAGAALLQAAQKDAIKALAEIQELRKAEREAARRMMAGANFASGRERGASASSSSKGPESKGGEADTYENMMRSLKLQGEQAAQGEGKAAPGKAGPGHRKQLSEKLVDEVIALEIQRDLMQLYSQPEVRTYGRTWEGGMWIIEVNSFVFTVQPPSINRPPQRARMAGASGAAGAAEGGGVRAVPLRRAPPPLPGYVPPLWPRPGSHSRINIQPTHPPTTPTAATTTVKLLDKPILGKYPQLGEGESGYRNIDRALGQHLLTSNEVKENSKRIMKLLMGDLFEE